MLQSFGSLRRGQALLNWFLWGRWGDIEVFWLCNFKISSSPHEPLKCSYDSPHPPLLAVYFLKSPLYTLSATTDPLRSQQGIMWHPPPYKKRKNARGNNYLISVLSLCKWKTKSCYYMLSSIINSLRLSRRRFFNCKCVQYVFRRYRQVSLTSV